MIPPQGFKAEVYPLRHRIINSFGLSGATETKNSAFINLVRHTTDVATVPELVVVNPHNTAYMTETGPAVRKMSIIDKLRLSLRFNMTENATVDKIDHLRFYWRPIFFSFPEKLDAADDDTTTTVAAILGLTKDATFEDVVPITTTNLPVTGESDLAQAMSSVNIVEVFGDYNMTVDTIYEDHPWDETLFQEASRRYTNKGALNACVGRTRYVNLTRNRPFKNFFIDKFVPRAIRRVVPYTFMGIQIELPIESDISQDYWALGLTGSVAHLGVKSICTYHEWNQMHRQDMTGDGT